MKWEEGEVFKQYIGCVQII